MVLLLEVFVVVDERIDHPSLLEVYRAAAAVRTTAEQVSVIVCYRRMDTVLEFVTSLIGLVLLGAALMFSLGCYFLWRGRRKLKGS